MALANLLSVRIDDDTHDRDAFRQRLSERRECDGEFGTRHILLVAASHPRRDRTSPWRFSSSVSTG